MTPQEIIEGNLVMLRLEVPTGYSDTWWRVKFIDNDSTFVGELERKHWREYPDHEKGDHVRFRLSQVKRIYQPNEQFCYSDDTTICSCTGLCKEK